jgi:hypothetical protein
MFRAGATRGEPGVELTRRQSYPPEIERYIIRTVDPSVDQVELIERMQESSDRILSRRGGKLLSDSVPAIRAARQARMDDLSRRSRADRKKSP